MTKASIQRSVRTSLEFENHVECIYYIYMLVFMNILTAAVWVGMMEAKVLCVSVCAVCILQH